MVYIIKAAKLGKQNIKLIKKKLKTLKIISRQRSSQRSLNLKKLYILCT